MARVKGADAVLVSDPMPATRERAKRFGATHTFPADSDLINQVREATAGRGADLVLELAGTADTVRVALAAARVGGKVVLAGTVAPVGTVPLDPEQAVRRMLTVQGVHNYHPRDLGEALEFLAGPGQQYPWAELVAAQYPLSEVEQAFADAHARPGVRVAVMPEASA
jgi:alcohol dehydrogenase